MSRDEYAESDPSRPPAPARPEFILLEFDRAGGVLGEVCLLAWEATGATAVEVDDYGVFELAGAIEVVFEGTRRLTLVAHGPGGSTVARTEVMRTFQLPSIAFAVPPAPRNAPAHRPFHELQPLPMRSDQPAVPFGRQPGWDGLRPRWRSMSPPTPLDTDYPRPGRGARRRPRATRWWWWAVARWPGASTFSSSRKADRRS